MNRLDLRRRPAPFFRSKRIDRRQLVRRATYPDSHATGIQRFA